MKSGLPTSTNTTINFSLNLTTSQVIYSVTTLKLTDLTLTSSTRPPYYKSWRKGWVSVHGRRTQPQQWPTWFRFNRVNTAGSDLLVAKNFLYTTTMSYSLNTQPKNRTRLTPVMNPLLIKWFHLNSRMWDIHLLQTYRTLSFLLIHPIKFSLVSSKAEVKAPVNPFSGLQYL
jgi:hypothetical protein